MPTLFCRTIGLLSVNLQGSKNKWQPCVAIVNHFVIYFAHDEQPEHGLFCLVKAALFPTHADPIVHNR